MNFFNRKSKDVTEKPRAGSAIHASNPYLNARREWNMHVGSVINSRNTWMVVGLMALLIAMGAVGGLVMAAMQPKYVPYVVEVDKLGQATAVSAIPRSSPADERIISSTISTLISNLRLVTPDAALQRTAVNYVYAHLDKKDPATNIISAWYSEKPESNPFKRAEREMVSTEISSPLRQTDETWQVDWEETTRDRDGTIRTKVKYRALVAYYIVPPTSSTTWQQVQSNPASIYIRTITWVKQQ